MPPAPKGGGIKRYAHNFLPLCFVSMISTVFVGFMSFHIIITIIIIMITIIIIIVMIKVIILIVIIIIIIITITITIIIISVFYSANFNSDKSPCSKALMLSDRHQTEAGRKHTI